MTEYRTNKDNKDNGWRSASTKKNVRRALKQQTNPAPKREREPIVWAGDEYTAQTGQQKPSQKKAGTGNTLRNYRHKLKMLEKRNARTRPILRIKNKIEHLERDLEARKQLAEEKAAKETQYFDDLKDE